jgi:membrane fusion protein, multidrug efflux system
MKRILMYFSLCLGLVHTGCESKKEKEEEKVNFLVTSPLKQDTTITETFVSQIHSISHIELRAQERGYLQKIYVDEGQLVKKGQLLFQIMPNLYEAEMKKTQAEVSFAEIEYQNTASLASRNVVAKTEQAMAKAKLDKAKAELALARVHLQFTEIRAPFDGIIDRFHVRLGSLLEEGELLTNLSDNRKMWVYYNVPEAQYLDYKSQAKKDTNMQVKLLLANNQVFPYTGEVETIEGDFNSETGNIAFRATFPNPKGLLRHGETGNILITIPFKNALLIPQKATFEVLDKKYVYVVGNDNVIRSKEITVAAELPHIFVVQKGLTENDKILLEGLRLVREKEKIQYKFLKPETVMSKLDLYAE